MKNIYYIKTYDCDGEKYDAHIISDLPQKAFEKLLVKLNTLIKNEHMVSNMDIYHRLIDLLEENGCDIGYLYKTEYTLEDDCPTPNSAYIKKTDTTYNYLR
jgi:hypothetical protein